MLIIIIIIIIIKIPVVCNKLNFSAGLLNSIYYI